MRKTKQLELENKALRRWGEHILYLYSIADVDLQEWLDPEDRASIVPLNTSIILNLSE